MRVTSHSQASQSCDNASQVSARCHSELCLQLFVHHIADADGGDDFEEIGGQASVEPSRALGLQDLLEETGHCRLLAALCRSCKDREKKHLTLDDVRNFTVVKIKV